MRNAVLKLYQSFLIAFRIKSKVLNATLKALPMSSPAHTTLPIYCVQWHLVSLKTKFIPSFAHLEMLFPLLVSWLNHSLIYLVILFFHNWQLFFVCVFDQFSQ